MNVGMFTFHGNPIFKQLRTFYNLVAILTLAKDVTISIGKGQFLSDATSFFNMISINSICIVLSLCQAVQRNLLPVFNTNRNDLVDVLEGTHNTESYISSKSIN